MKASVLPRVRAALIHLLASALVCGAIYAAFWFMVYPPPLFAASGAASIFLLLLLVDVSLGPFLTLIVYNPQKRSLKVDLAVVVALQLSALVYGAWTLYVARPVYIAYVGPRFDLVTANNVDESDLQKSGQRLPRLGPRMVAALAPDDPIARSDFLLKSLTGADTGSFPSLHKPIETARDELMLNAEPVVNLKLYNPPEAVDAWLKARGLQPTEVGFFGLKSRERDLAVLLSTQTGEILDIASFKPWAE